MSGHAFPMRLFDRVLETGAGRSVVRKVVAHGEALGARAAAQHLPEALLIEAMVQAALPLVGAGEAGRGAAGAPPRAAGLLVAIHVVRIHRRVGPGDVLRITATAGPRLGGLVRVTSRADLEEGGVPVAEGEFTISTGTLAEPGPRADPPAGEA